MYIIKWRKDVNTQSSSQLASYKMQGWVHVNPDIFEVFCIEMLDIFSSMLTYICWIPNNIDHFPAFSRLFTKKAKAVGTFRREGWVIHEEIFGSPPELSLSSRKVTITSEIKNMLKAETEEEEKLEIQRLNLNMEDRKHKYDRDKIKKYLQFKERMVKKMGVEATSDLTDNSYCRFLDGYLFDFDECEKNMTNMIVAFLYSEMENRKQPKQLENDRLSRDYSKGFFEDHRQRQARKADPLFQNQELHSGRHHCRPTGFFQRSRCELRFKHVRLPDSDHLPSWTTT